MLREHARGAGRSARRGRPVGARLRHTSADMAGWKLAIANLRPIRARKQRRESAAAAHAAARSRVAGGRVEQPRAGTKEEARSSVLWGLLLLLGLVVRPRELWELLQLDSCVIHKIMPSKTGRKI
jgi:hypothetical protein